MSRVVVEFHFQDNNGKRAQLRLHCPFRTAALVDTFARVRAAALSAVSDAVLVEVRQLWTYTDLELGSPGPNSNCRQAILLCYRNGDEVSTLSLPSPTGLPLDTIGPYAGIRLSRNALELSGMLPAVEDIVRGALDPVGRPYGDHFVVGGIISR